MSLMYSDLILSLRVSWPLGFIFIRSACVKLRKLIFLDFMNRFFFYNPLKYVAKPMKRSERYETEIGSIRLIRLPAS
ncbi:hypothetical protein EMIT013CA1_150058 [Bacillus sp. IT-13CA1]